MPHYQSFDPKAELNGRTTFAFISNINHDDIATILQQHGLDTIDPNTWYPIQQVLDVLSDISEHDNAMSNFVGIGIAATQLGLGAMPDEMKQMSLETFLTQYPQIYATRIRGGDGGEVEFKKQDDHHFIVTMRLPFPDDVFYGVMYAYVRHFCPPDKQFLVYYDTSIPGREQGGELTVVHIELQDKETRR